MTAFVLAATAVREFVQCVELVCSGVHLTKDLLLYFMRDMVVVTTIWNDYENKCSIFIIGFELVLSLPSI